MRTGHRRRASWNATEHLAGRRTATGVDVLRAKGCVPGEHAQRVSIPGCRGAGCRGVS